MEFEDSDSPVVSPDSGQKPESNVLLSFWERLDRSSRLLLDPPNCTAAHIAQLRSAILSYDRFAKEELSVEHDHFQLVGQDNHRRYLPASPLRIRLHQEDNAFEVAARCAAAIASNCRAILSHPASVHESTIAALEKLTYEWAGRIEFLEENDEELLESIANGQVARLRYAASSRVPDSVRRAANRNQVFIADQRVSTLGRIELLWYVMEQSISFDYHRYGNLGPRSSEKRADTL